jgi:ferredoxin
MGLQNATMRNISAENIPGAGHPEIGDGQTRDEVYEERIKKIDTAKFLAGCSRCGVCIQKCPFQAISSDSLAVPQLNDVTRKRCPAYENCGICAVVCPTDCLNDAFSDFDGEPSVDKPGWWRGPYEKREQQPGI